MHDDYWLIVPPQRLPSDRFPTYPAGQSTAGRMESALQSTVTSLLLPGTSYSLPRSSPIMRPLPAPNLYLRDAKLSYTGAYNAFSLDSTPTIAMIPSLINYRGQLLINLLSLYRDFRRNLGSNRLGGVDPGIN
jgi:hypothetical protein